MGKDVMENGPRLWAKIEVGCKSKKLKKSQEKWQKNLAVMEEGLWFKQSSRGAPAASSSHYELEIKIAV